MIIAYSGNNIPEGYLLCNGAAISRTTYDKLFNIIGTIYGIGNNTTTFNLPNLINQFIQGNSTNGTYINAGLPNIIGFSDIWDFGSGACNATGAFYNVLPYENKPAYIGNNDLPIGIQAQLLGFNANYSNNIYGAANTVQPPALTMKYIIKAY